MDSGVSSRRVEPSHGGEDLQVHGKARVVENVVGQILALDNQYSSRALFPFKCIFIRWHGAEDYFLQIGNSEWMELLAIRCPFRILELEVKPGILETSPVFHREQYKANLPNG